MPETAPATMTVNPGGQTRGSKQQTSWPSSSSQEVQLEQAGPTNPGEPGMQQSVMNKPKD